MRQGIWIVALVVCLANTARAEGAAAESPEPEPDWSLGAGIGGSGFIRGKLTEGTSSRDSVNFTAELGSSPSVFIEHRLNRSLWLMGRATFSYGSTTTGPTTSSNSADSSKTKRVITDLDGELSLGLRGVLARMKRVQLSAYGSVGFGLTRITDGTIATDGVEGQRPDVTNGYNIAGAFGVTCDAFLTPNIALRLSTPLVGLTYEAAKTVALSPVGGGGFETFTSPVSSITGGLVISPSLELRILF